MMAEENTVNPTPEHPEHAATEGNLSAAGSHLAAGARDVIAQTGLEREGPSLATAALIGVGVAIIEPELIPGMLIGVGAAVAPKVLPALGNMVRPLVKSVIRLGYSATTAVREAAAQVGEEVEDIVAEVQAEEAHNGANPAPAPVSQAERTRKQRKQHNAPVPTES